MKAIEAELRALVDERVRALRAKDLERVMSMVARGVVAFDVVDPLQRTGVEAVRRRGEEWFASFQGPIGYEVRDVTVWAADDVGFSHTLNHVRGTLKTGVEVDMWLRETLCWRKLGGAWQITHQHGSVPFDPASGRASLSLEP